MPRFPLRFRTAFAASVWLTAVALPCVGQGFRPIDVPFPVVANVTPRVTGNPFVRVWRAEDFDGGATSSSVVQHLRSGFIYVANSEGVLEFDGAHWRLIALPKKGAADALAIDARGRIWVGASNEIARLEPDARGGLLAQARTLLARDDYDLVFLDIQLRGGRGFDLVPLVRPGAQVIFVTAHDEHALRAFEVNALDYLLKPVHPDRLARSLERLGAAPVSRSAPASLPPLRDDDTVFIKTDSGARFVPLAEICAILSCENYSEVLLASGEKFLVRRTLKSWEDALPKPPFGRAHRQVLANLSRLARIEDDGGDGPLLHVTGLRAPVRASRREWAALREAQPHESGDAFRPGK